MAQQPIVPQSDETPFKISENKTMLDIELAESEDKDHERGTEMYCTQQQ